jgi:antirestriction protein ArdC
MPNRSDEHRDKVTAAIINLLEKGAAPWQKPWDANNNDRRPYNPITDKNYRGVNSFWLGLQGYSDPRWMTYKQAHEHGFQVRKGSTGTPIEYWKFYDEHVKTDEHGQPITGLNGETLKIRAELERPRVFFATVFNAEQIDNLPPLVRKARVYEWKPEDRAEEILRGSGARILHDQADRAFYSPLRDEIHLPQKDQFNDAGAYYGTAMHELAHWTGHESRLNRQYGVFGDELYAREELRAEIASWLISDAIGVPHDPGRHTGYLASWLKSLREDKNEIFRAVRDAEIIQEYAVSCSREQTQAIAHTLAEYNHSAEGILQAKQHLPEAALLASSRENSTEQNALVQFITHGGDSEEFIHTTPLGSDEFRSILDAQTRDPRLAHASHARQFKLFANHLTQSMNDSSYPIRNSPDPITITDAATVTSLMESVFEAHSSQTGKDLVNDLTENLQPGENRGQNIKNVFYLAVNKSTYDNSVSFQILARPGREHELAQMLRTAAAQASVRANAIGHGHAHTNVWRQHDLPLNDNQNSRRI